MDSEDMGLHSFQRRSEDLYRAAIRVDRNRWESNSISMDYPILTQNEGYSVVRILQSFEKIEYCSSGDGPVYKCEIVLSPVNGVRVKFHASSESR